LNAFLAQSNLVGPRVNLVDWTRLPDLAAVALLTCAFASVARQGATAGSKPWLVGWVLITFHFAALLFLQLPGLIGDLASAIDVACLAAGGVLFMWAAVPYRNEPSSQWMLIAQLATSTFYVTLVSSENVSPWALNVAAVLLGLAPLVVALIFIKQFSHPMRWALVVACLVLSAFLLMVQHHPEIGPKLALRGVLFSVYGGCCLNIWYSYRRFSAGALITIVGFCGWAVVFLISPLAGALLPNPQIESEVLNLPKFVVAVGMILLLLEDQIEHNKYLALHDELTGLPNRRLFLDRLTLALERCRRMETKAALLVVDLDHFKQVNDSLGHHAGDLLLQRVSSLFSTRVRRYDTVARTGGDEFSVILEEPTDRSNANLVAQSLLQLLEEPVQLLNRQLKVGASIGVAIFPDDAADMEALCIFADLQMYECKRSSRDRDRTAALIASSSNAAVIPSERRESTDLR
jgi:diguanylate cyclase (GGDEF)-like protein